MNTTFRIKCCFYKTVEPSCFVQFMQACIYLIIYIFEEIILLTSKLQWIMKSPFTKKMDAKWYRQTCVKLPPLGPKNSCCCWQILTDGRYLDVVVSSGLTVFSQFIVKKNYFVTCLINTKNCYLIFEGKKLEFISCKV
jgi:hypothetical protein